MIFAARPLADMLAGAFRKLEEGAEASDVADYNAEINELRRDYYASVL